MLSKTVRLASDFAIGGDGTLVYVPGTVTVTDRDVVVVSRDGLEQPLGIARGQYSYLSLSRAGDRLAVDEANTQDGDLWLWSFESGNAMRLAGGDVRSIYPVWSRDDSRLTFGVDGANGIRCKAASNTGAVELLTAATGEGAQIATPCFFADENTLVFREQAHPDTADNIGMVSLEPDAEPVWLLVTEFNERNAVLSPDGWWMAY